MPRNVIERVMVLPDIHAPYHDVKALKLVNKVAKSFRPQGVVQQGDLWDAYLISKYPKALRGPQTIEQEADGAKAVRKMIDKWEPKWKKITLGNHEDRLRVYLETKAPQLLDTTDIDDVLDLTDNGWEVTAYRDHTRVGKVYFTHDTGSVGKYATFRALDDFQHSVCIAHLHRIQYAVAGDATGKCQVGAQFGWLGDVKQVDYMHKIKAKREWALGFGIGYHEVRTGHVFLTPIPIVNYSCIVEGKAYRA